MSKINFAQLQKEDVRQGNFRPGVENFPSRGLEQIWEHLSAGGEKKTILDLGRACQANIQFYANFRCTVVIEDFVSEYAIQRALPQPLNPKQTLYSVLDGVARKPFNVILAWDIFNYLNAKEATLFAQALTSIAAPDALLLLHVSSISQVPSLPRFYRISGKSELREEILTSAQSTCQRYSQRDLSQFFPHWRLKRSLQLRNSMQEHLFAFDVKKLQRERPESVTEELDPASGEVQRLPLPVN